MADGVPTGAPVKPTILVFDSGLGGLSVLQAIVDRLPESCCFYMQDEAAFPYGDWSAEALIQRVVGVLSRSLALYPPDICVIACNTASTLVLPQLRAEFSIPFVGTVPAIKPAAEGSRSGQISVLATPGTVQRDYTSGLIRDFASHCQVTLVGSNRLAPMAEAKLHGAAVDHDVVRAEIAPAFVERDGVRTDTVVLACTHYPWLLDELRAVAPWPVEWIDPAPAIARQVVHVLSTNPTPPRAGECGIVITTASPTEALSPTRPQPELLSHLGLNQVRALDL